MERQIGQISYEAPNHQRPVLEFEDGSGRVIGFVRLTMGGHWTAHCYRRGHGISPLSSEDAAIAWVRNEHAKGPIPNYSR